MQIENLIPSKQGLNVIDEQMIRFSVKNQWAESIGLDIPTLVSGEKSSAHNKGHEPHFIQGCHPRHRVTGKSSDRLMQSTRSETAGAPNVSVTPEVSFYEGTGRREQGFFPAILTLALYTL